MMILYCNLGIFSSTVNNIYKCAGLGSRKYEHVGCAKTRFKISSTLVPQNFSRNNWMIELTRLLIKEMGEVPICSTHIKVVIITMLSY